MPQVLKNVRYGGHSPLEDEAVQRAVAGWQKTLGARGRLVIRPSGTEPLIRVMGEGEDEDEVANIVEELVGLIERVATLEATR